MTPENRGAELPPERKARLAVRLAWMMAIGAGTPLLFLALLANALMPCANGAACKGGRGILMGGCAILFTAAAALLARRRIRSALDAPPPGD